jgi:hypothetical protein
MVELDELVVDHEAVWAAIYEAARRRGLTPCGLAKECGLDGTTFNPSKRVMRGKPRWPTASVIGLVCLVCQISWAEFGALVDGFIQAREEAA